MDIEISCWDESGNGEEYHFQFKLPNNTKKAKLRFEEGGPNCPEGKQIILEEIEFYEVSNVHRETFS